MLLTLQENEAEGNKMDIGDWAMLGRNPVKTSNDKLPPIQKRILSNTSLSAAPLLSSNHPSTLTKVFEDEKDSPSNQVCKLVAIYPLPSSVCLLQLNLNTIPNALHWLLG